MTRLLTLSTFAATAALSQTAPCTIQTIAGPPSFFGGDGGPATSAYFHNIGGFRFDQFGNLYIADTDNQRVRKVTPAGIVTTIAGTGVAGYSGDGGPAISAQLYLPVAVSPDSQGNLYIAEGDNRIRMINSSGVITTFAGNGTANFAGDGGPATAAEIQSPVDVLADDRGNVYIADTGNFRVREVNPQGIISTVAGSAVDEPYYVYRQANPPRQLGGPATAYSLENPTSLAVDSAGNLFIADNDLAMVFEVDANGVIRDFAGNGQVGTSPLGQPATSAEFAPVAIAFDTSGNLVIASPVGSAAGGIFAVSPSGVVSQLTPDIGLNIALNQTSLYYGFENSIYLAASNAIYAGATTSGNSGDGGSATNSPFMSPGPIAADSQGSLYIVDPGASEIHKVAPDGTMTRFAGTGTAAGPSGDGGPATEAGIGLVEGIATDSAGNVYFTDIGTVREVNTQGIISTIIGAQGQLIAPTKLAVDPSGAIYVQEELGVFVFTHAGTQQSTFPVLSQADSFAWALDPNGGLYSISGGTLTNVTANTAIALPEIAEFQGAQLAIDGYGNAYLSAYPGSDIQEVTPTGIIVDIARHNAAWPYVNGPANQVDLGQVAWLVSDATGNLYFADTLDRNVRELAAGCPVVEQPLIPWNGVVNAASFDSTALVAGEIAAIFGQNLGPANGVVVPVNLGLFGEQFSTQFDGVAVTVNGYPAPLLYVSQAQVNFVTPFEVEGQRGRTVQLTYNGTSTAAYFNEGEADPGIFAIANADNSVNSASNPEKAGSYVVIYGTGQGVSNPPQTDGEVMGDSLSLPVTPVTATIDGQPAIVLYAGSAPGLVAGVLQINLQLPDLLPYGQHSLVISSGTASNALQGSVLFTQ